MFEKKKEPNAPPYLLGVITHIDKSNKKVEVSGMVDSILFSKTLPYTNNEDININDLSTASELNEVDLLNNLTNRLINSKNTFTSVGPTLIIVNPYQKDDSIYSTDKIDFFIKEHENHPPDLRTSCQEPHLYDTVLIAVKHLITKQINQAIVISGESGAGKTETAKNCMNCITYYCNKYSGKDTKLSEQILKCNPILEAFGNAKTIINDNSSRFGKYIRIDIDTSNNEIKGAKIETYLLEKSRITQLDKNERNFHFFYHLLSCNDNNLLTSLHLTNQPESYNYLNVSTFNKINSIDDAKLFKETMDCFSHVGFSKEEINAILKMIAAVLLLGNLKFSQEPGGVGISNKETLKQVCELLQCDEEEMKKAFTINIRFVAGTEYPTPLSMQDASNYRDAFAKELYNKTFLWIIQKINSIINSEISEKSKDDNNIIDENIKHIGLLDIFGFECYDYNSLEQLCINYSNEKIQQLYLQDFFESEINEFKREGLGDRSNLIKYKNNQHIIDLLETSPSGLFLKLDDCSFQNKPDEYFIDILKKEFLKNKTIKLPRLKKDFNITISHSQKDVVYNITGFVVKNKDELKNTMIKMMINSKDENIKKIFFNVLQSDELKKELEELSKPTIKKNSLFLSGKFRKEINELIKEIKSCECNYIRCLKPNEEKKPFYVVPSLLFNQIQYLGIFDTIRVRKEGYPSRKEYKSFSQQFNLIYPHLLKLNESNSKIAQKILFTLIPNAQELNQTNPVPLFLFGTTKLYMKQDFHILVENKRKEKIKEKIKSSLIIQISINFLKKRQKIKNIQQSITNFQKFYDVNKYKIRKISKIKKILKIQALFHTKKLKNKFESVNKNYVRLQSFIKTIYQKQLFEEKLFHINCLSIRMRIYLTQLYEKRRKRMKETAKKLIKNSINEIIRIEYNQIWNKLYPFFLCILARKRNQSIALAGKLARENYSKTVVVKMFQMKMLFNKVSKKRKANNSIRQFSISQLSSNYFVKMRENTFIIQAYVKRYQEMILIRKKIINKFFSEDLKEKELFEIKMENCLFPSLRREKTKKLSQSSSSFFLPKYKEVNPKILSYSISTKKFRVDNNKQNNFDDDSNENNLNLVPHYSIYDEGKVKIFSKILAIDAMVNPGDVHDHHWHENYMTIFKQNMKSNSPIQIISIGDGHSLAINSKGKVFTWGWNQKGQCGMKFTHSLLSGILPKLTRNNNNKFPNLPIIFYQQPQSIDKTLPQVNIYSASACSDFSYLIDEKGKIYSFGENENGELGLGNTFPVFRPSQIPLRDNIKDIKSTKELSILLTKEGKIYIWNHKYKKGNESNHSIISPMLVNFEKKITIEMISCGCNFAILLSTKGVVYGMGNNSQGELGLDIQVDNIEDSKVPPLRSYYSYPEENRILSEYFKEKIISVKCGYKHVVSLSSIGKVYSWGNNGYGQLGIGNQDNMKIPMNISIDPSSKILQISAGFRASFFLNEKREIFYCGIVDKDNRSKIPKKFEIAKKSKEISNENSFTPVRILCSWNQNMSIFYATIADIRSLKNKIDNVSKIGKILNTLVSKWNNESSNILYLLYFLVLCPYIENISNYFSSSVMKKGEQVNSSSSKLFNIMEY